MVVRGAYRKGNALVLPLQEGAMRLEPCAPDILHVEYTLEASFAERLSRIVLPKAKTFCDWDFEETDAEIVLRTKELQVRIDRGTGAFTYRDATDTLLTREPARGGKTLDPFDLEKSEFDASERVESVRGVDGIRSNAVHAVQRFDRRSYHARLEFEWAEDEALYGLGSHEEGMMDLRGQHQYLYQQNMKAVVPVFLSTKGYGILMDCCSLMTFHDDAFGSYLWCEAVSELDYYFLHGPAFDKIIGAYRSLTGASPMLPRWAFGYVQSKERYRSQEELIQVVREYRRRGIPLDAIVLDWKSWTGDDWGQKSLDPERFPDPDAMMDELHGMGARLMVSVWPTLNEGGADHGEMKEGGFLLGDRITYDAFQEGARDLYWKQAETGLFRHGVDAWWCDCTEPFEADWKGPVKPEPEERLRINTDAARRHLDPEFLNAFSLLHSQGIYEGQRRTTDRKRVVNLTRSSYAGQHRYSTITWSGDISASWNTLKNQIPAGLNFCVTGEPYWTCDIGAFFVGGKSKWTYWCNDPDIPAPWFLEGQYDAGCDDPAYRELYVRWFQLGAFLPMFRAHGTDTPREVWRFGDTGGIFYETLVRFIRLRYRLLPYLYSVAWKVSHSGYSMMRMLAFDFREDPRVHAISDQFLLGPSLMVCPVTDPCCERDVYLPAGIGWYDFWTGDFFVGGQVITVQAPLEILPLFVREGSILPLGPVVQHVDEEIDAPLEVRIYPGRNGEFSLYEDDGISYDYEGGDYSTVSLEWSDATDMLTVGEREGGFRRRNDRLRIRPVRVARDHGVGSGEWGDGDHELDHNGRRIEIRID